MLRESGNYLPPRPEKGDEPFDPEANFKEAIGQIGEDEDLDDGFGDSFDWSP